MKTKVSSIRKLAFSGLFLGSLSIAGAVVPEKVNFTVLPNKRVVVESEFPQKQFANVEITNLATTEMVYNGKLPLSAAHKTVYNLSYLPEGQYSVIVEHNNMVYEKEIELFPGHSTVMKETKYASPVFNSNGNKLDIDYSNVNAEKVVIAFSRDSEKFFSDEIASPSSFSKTYDLSLLARGDYDVTLTSGDNVFYYDLSVR
jgi:hypothetical protein